MFVALIGACSLCSFLCIISRQFIARYVHDLIVKHNVRELSDTHLLWR